MISPRMWLSNRSHGSLLLCGVLWAMTCGLAAPTGLDAVDKPARTRERTTRKTDVKSRKDKDKSDDDKDATAEKSSTDSKLSPSKPSTGKSTTESGSRMEVARRTPSDIKPTPIAESTAHPLISPLKIAKESRTALSSIRDYSATLTKREFLRGRMIEQSMEIQVREQPFSVKLKFIQPYRGREVVYVEGQNRGRLLVRAEGFKALAGTLSFVPTGTEAMAENRHPITEIGFVKMLDITIQQWEKEAQLDPNHEVRITQDTKVGSASCQMIQVTRKKSSGDFPYYQSRLYLSQDQNFPVRVEHYDWPNGNSQPQILEDYTYSNIRTNLNLNDTHFR